MSGNVMALREGDVLAGKYRVDRVLGAGGMGVVVAAHHLGLDTRVAIKLLLPEMLAHQDIVARFAREARAAAKITNEHVTRVFDVGTLESGAPYLVMEFLDGIDLRELLRRQGPLPVPLAIDCVLQACEAIGEAHTLGIVHRDLKPANLFCVRRPDDSVFIKVLDFGISKVATGFGSGSQLSMTRTAALMGTPFYMSPEQMESARDVDGRSDIWALGVILFELLTGVVPFTGETLPEVCIKVATQPPPPVRRARPELPEPVEAAILKCLEKDRTRRFASVAELAAAVARFGSQQAVASAERLSRATPPVSSSRGPASGASVFGAGGPAATPLGGESLGAVGRTQTSEARRRRAVLGGIGAAVGLAAGVAFLALVPRATAPSAANPSHSGGTAAGGPQAPSAAPATPLELASGAALPAPAPAALPPTAAAAAAAPEAPPLSEPEERYDPPPVRGAPGGHVDRARRPPAATPADSAKTAPKAAAANAAAASPPRPATPTQPSSSSNPFDERL